MQSLNNIRWLTTQGRQIKLPSHSIEGWEDFWKISTSTSHPHHVCTYLHTNSSPGSRRSMFFAHFISIVRSSVDVWRPEFLLSRAAPHGRTQVFGAYAAASSTCNTSQYRGRTLNTHTRWTALISEVFSEFKMIATMILARAVHTIQVFLHNLQCLISIQR